MAGRIPAIVQNVLADHVGRYPPEITRALQELHAEIVEARPVRPLKTTAPDAASWAASWQPYQNRSWLDIPWFFAEAFFYRRLLEAVGYFGGRGESLAGWAGVDPFLPAKQTELQSDTPWRILALALSHTSDNSARSFRALLHHCVWGNRIDLSYTQVAEAAGRQIAVDKERANLLVDDTEMVLAHLGGQGSRGAGGQGSGRAGEQRSRGAGGQGSRGAGGRRSSTLIRNPKSEIRNPKSPQGDRVDFICDNAGTELLLDLALADFLLRFDWVRQVTLHVKAHPTFVSDATPADVDMTMAAIKSQPATELQALASRLEDYRQEERLSVEPDFFWNSSLFFWEIPPLLRAELAQAHLVIIKGDANYRRLLGDSRWPTTVPMADAIPYFPAPFVTLRTMKSDPVVGLKPGQAEALDQEDAEWRVNGRRGMIQAVV